LVGANPTPDRFFSATAKTNAVQLKERLLKADCGQLARHRNDRLDRNRPLKHVKRADIVLFSAERLSVQEVARHAGVSRPAVWRWQTRYAEHGVEGLLRDKTRKPGRAPLSAKIVAKVIDLTCSERPGHATHWTGRAMAKAVGVSLRAVQRLWEAHRLQPHRIRTFKRSNDPEFADTVENIVGLDMDPPKHAVVVSIDEKSQIQALAGLAPICDADGQPDAAFRRLFSGGPVSRRRHLAGVEGPGRDGRDRRCLFHRRQRPLPQGDLRLNGWAATRRMNRHSNRELGSAISPI
jgi:transposase